MPSIQQVGRSFRVQVMCNGVRKSASLKSREECDAWARSILQKYGRRTRLYLSLAEVRALPREQSVCGVYFLFGGESVVYVGQSVDVHRRVADHSERRAACYGHFDGYAIVRCDREQLDVLEAYYIKTLKPPLNKWRPSFWRKKELALDMAKLSRHVSQRPQKVALLPGALAEDATSS